MCPGSVGRGGAGLQSASWQAKPRQVYLLKDIRWECRTYLVRVLHPDQCLLRRAEVGRNLPRLCLLPGEQIPEHGQEVLVHQLVAKLPGLLGVRAVPMGKVQGSS